LKPGSAFLADFYISLKMHCKTTPVLCQRREQSTYSNIGGWAISKLPTHGFLKQFGARPLMAPRAQTMQSAENHNELHVVELAIFRH
jgi:hypothetical protein